VTTTLFFVLFCLRPTWFAWAAAFLTALTTFGRIREARQIFASPEAPERVAAPRGAA